MHVRQVLTLLFAAAALASSLNADPIPVATSASLTYTLLTSTDIRESFSFTGPDLNLSGTGAAGSADLPINIAPGVPFVYAPEIVDVDPGEGFISGTIGGVTASFFPFTPDRVSAPPVVFNVIDGAIPPITVPATAAGTVTMCTPLSCEFNGDGAEYQFTMDIPGFLTLQVINLGPVFDPLYKVGSAQFTPVPEPNTAVPMALAMAASIWCVRRQTIRRD